MLELSESDVASLIDMDVAIAAMRDLLVRTRRGDIAVLPRQRLKDGSMYLAVMAAMDRGAHLFSAKLYTTGLHRGSFKLLLWDSLNGHLLAMFDANRLGQLRTGAVSAVATDLLARPDADTLLVIGTGYQAETQVLAISRVRPLRRVFVHSRNPIHQRAFVERLRSQLPDGIQWVPVDSVAEAADQSSLIVTATTSQEPVLHGTWIRPGTHINAIGSNHADARELDTEVLERASILVTDHVAGARLESGDLIMGLSESDWSRVTTLERVEQNADPTTISVFVSQGIESEDLILGQYLMKRWAERHAAQVSKGPG